MTARDDILGRIRQALGPRSPVPVKVPRDYRQTGSLATGDLLVLFEHRLVDYRATVRTCGAADVVPTVAAALADRGAARVVVPAGLDIAMPAEVEAVVDDGSLSPAELDAFDGVVTRAAVAIADTGTFVLDATAGQGRRAITLVPDYHLCIVYADQIVETVPEAVARLQPDRPLTWVSGPSATSDIELERVEGVHGPRTLEVILVSDAAAGI